MKEHMGDLWSLQDVCHVIPKMRNIKAVGNDGIPAKNLKEDGADLLHLIHAPIFKILAEGTRV